MTELNSYLEKILVAKRKKIEYRRLPLEGIRNNTVGTVHSQYSFFKNAIVKPGQINLIAEIKKASPSKGMIREAFSAKYLSQAYQKAGASAISILTEESFFLGRPDYVRIAADESGLPILAKDFFIDELQIHEAFSYGAKAILLIMAILDDDTAKNFLEVATNLDMDCLVEVHTEEELARALKCGADIIGVNNRNLKTFEVDLNAGEKIIRQIPTDKVKVVESGIQTHEDIVRFEEAGANAVLIGETFMRAKDVGEKVKEVMGR